MQKLRFIHDAAGDVARASIKNWKGWRSHELHLHALQTDLDDLVTRLGALIAGDNRPFETAEFSEWRVRRDAAQ
jgi:hypothetical protein